MRQRPARAIAEAAVLTGALIGFGITFPPWGYARRRRVMGGCLHLEAEPRSNAVMAASGQNPK